MTHNLMNLPFKKDALGPYISQETIEYHYEKHHAGYVNKLNDLIKGTEFENLALEEIVKKSSGAIFNNAAQIFNHNFYWESLTPNRCQPSKNLLDAINKKFGSLDTFKEKFSAEAINCFGSGWAWLILDENRELAITATSNAHTPIEKGLKPLLVCDVWEHAYYIDKRNLRAKYVEDFWNIVNWDNVSRLFESK